jgi:hypothetical protein
MLFQDAAIIQNGEIGKAEGGRRTDTCMHTVPKECHPQSKVFRIDVRAKEKNALHRGRYLSALTRNAKSETKMKTYSGIFLPLEQEQKKKPEAGGRHVFAN